jgi:fumarate reductase subunit D
MRSKVTPSLWALFSVGGTIAALLFPIHVFLTGLAVPLGWIPAPGYESLLNLIRHPVTRIYLLVLISLPLFHGAHRFRYTLYDGLKLKHLTLLIVIMCYGSALLGTVAAAVLLWRIP